MNSTDFVSHTVNREFHDGTPLYDFVMILYRAVTPKGRQSKYYHMFWYRYDHDQFANRLDRINECLAKSARRKKPKLRHGYRWGRAKVMRVD